VIAAQRPEMRFVEPKTEAQQALAVVFRARDRLVRQRTELVNALRSTLYEYGHVIPQGIVQLKRIEAILNADGNALPAIVCDAGLRSNYIEMFYNPKSKHVRNGMLSPVDFERQQKMSTEGV
jgi:transposase